MMDEVFTAFHSLLHSLMAFCYYTTCLSFFRCCMTIKRGLLFFLLFWACMGFLCVAGMMRVCVVFELVGVTGCWDTHTTDFGRWVVGCCKIGEMSLFSFHDSITFHFS